MRKGQVWSFDMALSMMIFFSAAITILFAWNYMSTDIIARQEMNSMQLRAMTVSDSLIRTPGLPQDWNESSVTSIGLAYEDNVLEPEKVEKFVNMAYSKSRSLLGLAPYEFYFEVADINGTVYSNSSLPVDDGAYMVIPASRYAVYGGRIVKATLVVWM